MIENQRLRAGKTASKRDLWAREKACMRPGRHKKGGLSPHSGVEGYSSALSLACHPAVMPAR